MIRIWDLSMLSLRRRKKFLVYELLSGGDLHYHLERSRSGEAHPCFPWRFFIRRWKVCTSYWDHLGSSIDVICWYVLFVGYTWVVKYLSPTVLHPVAKIPWVAENVDVFAGELPCLSPENSSLRCIKGSLPYGESGASDVSPGYQAIEHRVG